MYISKHRWIALGEDPLNALARPASLNLPSCIIDSGLWCLQQWLVSDVQVHSQVVWSSCLLVEREMLVIFSRQNVHKSTTTPDCGNPLPFTSKPGR